MRWSRLQGVLMVPKAWCSVLRKRHCGVVKSALANRAKTTAHPRQTSTRPPANFVDFEKRGDVDSTGGDQMGLASDRRLPAEGRQTSGIPASNALFSRAEALREVPTPGGCMRETAQTFFSLHRTFKRNDAQKRRKLVSDHAIRREQMETSGRHTGTWATTLNNTCMDGTGSYR